MENECQNLGRTQTISERPRVWHSYISGDVINGLILLVNTKLDA